uniref:Uncharacterized protein n=1 Tax=Amphimedon queenslandica TaxID=400682 RepID=A0A1X7UFH7_AMPQE
MESSSEDSDCTNPDNDYIYKPRSSRIAKRLKGDSESKDNATSTCAMYTSPKTRRKSLASTKKALRKQAAPKRRPGKP